MANGFTNYSKKKWSISDVSWRNMLSQDPYFWLKNSFQYSENINCDDELHGIKLSQRIMSKNDCANCQLVSAGDMVFTVPMSGWNIKYFERSQRPSSFDLTWFPGGTIKNTGGSVSWTVGEAVIFQDRLRASYFSNTESTFSRIQKPSAGGTPTPLTVPTAIYDHIEDSDESISSISLLGLTTFNGTMWPGINQVLNFNNTRLVCGVGQDLWVYYPELDKTGDQQYDPNTQTIRTVVFGETGWKKVQRFEAGCQIVGLTCDFEYLKVRVTDEGWNTKMYYYPGNNDLRNTFVYNIIDMTGTKVLRTYNINGVDYFTASLDGTDSYITFNKVIGKIPIQIFTQRGGLCKYDINQKAWYFVGPTSRGAEYINGDFYVADSYGVFKFEFQPSSIDPGYLKWKVRSTAEKTIGLCIAWNFVFISDQHGIKAMRLYDTGVDWYESKGILISREMEGDFGGCVSKVLDSVKCHFELNTVISDSQDAGDIDIYMSPNNQWRNVDPESDSTGRWHVLHIDGDASKQNRNTRYEEVNELNKLNNGNPAFEFNRETITYCVVIKSNDEEAQWTPVVREILAQYHLEGKTNDVYELTN